MPIQENILPLPNEQTIRSGLEEFGGIANRITDSLWLSSKRLRSSTISCLYHYYEEYAAEYV